MGVSLLFCNRNAWLSLCKARNQVLVHPPLSELAGLFMQSYKQKMRIYAKIVNKIEEGIIKFKDFFLLVNGHNILFLRTDL